MLRNAVSHGRARIHAPGGDTLNPKTVKSNEVSRWLVEVQMPCGKSEPTSPFRSHRSLPRSSTRVCRRSSYATTLGRRSAPNTRFRPRQRWTGQMPVHAFRRTGRSASVLLHQTRQDPLLPDVVCGPCDSDERPTETARGGLRAWASSHLGTVPASSAHHYCRARPLGERARQNTAGAACQASKLLVRLPVGAARPARCRLAVDLP